MDRMQVVPKVYKSKADQRSILLIPICPPPCSGVGKKDIFMDLLLISQTAYKPFSPMKNSIYATLKSVDEKENWHSSELQAKNSFPF